MACTKITMSDTVSKRDGEDESQDNIAGAANDDDDDLDAALFGEDDEGADDEPTDADAVPMEGLRLALLPSPFELWNHSLETCVLCRVRTACHG